MFLNTVGATTARAYPHAPMVTYLFVFFPWGARLRDPRPDADDARRVPLSHTGAASTDPTGSAGEPATAAPVRGVNAAPPQGPRVPYLLPPPVPTHIGRGLHPGGADTWTRAT